MWHWLVPISHHSLLWITCSLLVEMLHIYFVMLVRNSAPQFYTHYAWSHIPWFGCTVFVAISNPAKPYSLEPFLYDSLQFYIIITSISAAEKEALQNEASGERALRTATSSAAISLRLPLRKPRRQLTPEELEERRIKVCTLT